MIAPRSSGSKKGGLLPSNRAFNCKKCGGRSRASWSDKLRSWFLICDNCQRGCIALASLYDWIDDLTGN